MASLGLHFQWLIPLPTEQLSKSHTWGWTSGLARITGLLSVKVLPGHSPQWWWSGMGEISGGLWVSGSLQREPQCGQMAVQDLCQEPGTSRPSCRCWMWLWVSCLLPFTLTPSFTWNVLSTWSLQSACPISKGQHTPHLWEALLPAGFSHLLPSTSFQPHCCPLHTHTHTHRETS